MFTLPSSREVSDSNRIRERWADDRMEDPYGPIWPRRTIDVICLEFKPKALIAPLRQAELRPNESGTVRLEVTLMSYASYLGRACVFFGSAALVGTVACSDFADRTESERLGASQGAIIGGRPGGPMPIGHMFPINQPINFCTATLVAPTLVLLAKHCIYVNEDPTQQHLIDTTTIRFSLADTNDSSQWTDGVDAVAVYEAPRLPPQMNGDRYFEGNLASDVAVYRLARPITSVAPIPISPDPPGPANPRFLAVGFGRVAHNGQAATSKNSGMLTFGQNGGSVLRHLFPTVDDYIAAVSAISPLVTQPADSGAPHQTIAGLRDEYQHEVLGVDYEMWFQAGPNDVQVCFGDSGGPLLQADASGNLHVFGVVSGSKSYSAGSDNDKCYFGSVYATFGPNTLAFLRSLGLVPPRIDGGPLPDGGFGGGPPGLDGSIVTGVGGAAGTATTGGSGAGGAATTGMGGAATTGGSTTAGSTTGGGTTSGTTTTSGATTSGATTSGATTSGATTGGRGGAGGASSGPATGSTEGCSCRTNASPGQPYAAALAAAALLALGRRRRRGVTMRRAG
jgi:MYXO-CTERM domain-containing protein